MPVDGGRPLAVPLSPGLRLAVPMAMATLALVCVVGFSPTPAAGAQAAGVPATQAPEGVVVVVDTSDVLPSGSGSQPGVLRRSDRESPVPLFATYLGLSAVGATLALITTHRRGARRRERELVTGVAFVRRRRPQDFWLAEMSSARSSS